MNKIMETVAVGFVALIIGILLGALIPNDEVQPINQMQPNLHAQLQDLNASYNYCVWQIENQWRIDSANEKGYVAQRTLVAE